MYVPKHFNVDEFSTLTNYIKESSFASLVTSVEGVPYATHLPMSFDPDAGEFGTLYAHVARANDHWKYFDRAEDSLAIFTGIHAYISPNWMAAKNAVPTWNYIAVHAYGRPKIIENPDAVLALLGRLTNTYESDATGNWTADKMDQKVLHRLLKAIVAFEFPVSRLEGKRKMSQNKGTEAQKSAADGLGKLTDPGSVAVAKNMNG